ncbi:MULTISPECIES: hypothetical protein [unclassified Bradyrhizobium]|uniref:hypothetical protein n=1 Tax=unclassified Bradyrhizobium TaxID=2631580 RepID=UPI0016064DD3|nr:MULTISPECIES: hypothetical protein [unclassified Bradyrhizobium]MBB4262835.1 hypothetical protein [Bradyrhizobium sp. CIR3A]MBB4360702.1 hypothetical protein [Bradyrhizobium sp. CIR18]MBB4393682.1 hypothetical protein [Bradyrhizobium sp. ERR14]MBB4429615.1 hypothetical protein [Bradyrhizobium sp. CIR48]
MLNRDCADAALDGTLVQFGSAIHRLLKRRISCVQLGPICLALCHAGSLSLSLVRTTLLLQLHETPIQANDMCAPRKLLVRVREDISMLPVR